KTRLAIGHSSSMRRIFEKSICKCRRCVAKRRIRFLTVLGICIAMVAGCYVLVDHSKRGVPPSSNAQEASADEPIQDCDALTDVIYMTAVPATVILSDKQGNCYRIVLRITSRRFRGAFNNLHFGENVPATGSYEDG